MTTQSFAAPLPPYAVHAPVALAPPQAPAFVPVPTTVPIHLPPIQYRAVASAAPTRTRREIGMIVAGAALLFTAVLLVIAFVVQLRTYVGLDAHWAANASLVAEARDLGLASAKHSTLLRVLAFGPAGIALGIAGIVALVSGARRR